MGYAACREGKRPCVRITTGEAGAKFPEIAVYLFGGHGEVTVDGDLEERFALRRADQARQDLTRWVDRIQRRDDALSTLAAARFSLCSAHDSAS